MRLILLFMFLLTSCSSSDGSNAYLCNANKLNRFLDYDIFIDIKNKKATVFDINYSLNPCGDSNVRCLYGKFSYLEPARKFQYYSSIKHLKNIKYIRNKSSFDVVEFERVEGSSYTAYTYFFDDRKNVQFLYVVERSPVLSSSALYERC